VTKGIEPTWIADTVNFDDFPLGSRQRFSLAVEPNAAPPAPHLDFQVVVGRRHHPRLILAAGIHGDEYDGILAVAGLAGELEPETLDGTVVLLPVVNPFAHAAGQRRTPEDNTDLNRVFPGRPDGTLSERLAHRLCQGLLRQADLIFTLHGAMASGYLTPWIEFLNEDSPVARATFELARATGIPDMIALANLPGRLQRSLADLGVPVVEGEVGGRGATRSENVAYYQERARRVMRHAGLLPPATSPETAATQTIWLLSSIDAATDGIFLRQVDLNAQVREGDLLGRIVDSSGAIRSEVRSPRAGKIGGYRDHAGVRVGDSLFTLWLPTDQSRLEESI
jgi:predicted deacylase